jgi:hypothetical protein
MQDQERTETETKLRAAADWRPPTEMPIGLERRALESQRRPPLRPIGITRPRTALLTTALAGALCLTVVARLDKPTVPASPVMQQTPTPMDESPRPLKELGTQKPQMPTPRQKMGSSLANLGRQKQDLPRHFKQLPRQKPLLERRKQDSPTTHRFPVAVDTPTDSVRAGNRVAIEAPAYTPAYFAQTSEDGESVTYTPVAMPLDDPDVIASEARPID